MLCLFLACRVPAYGFTVHWTEDMPADAISISQMLKASDRMQGVEVQRFARSLLAAQSYFWPELRLIQDELHINAGPRGRIGDISIEGLSQDTVNAARAFKAACSGRTDESALKAGVMAVVQHLVAAGYPYAQVQLTLLDATGAPRLNVTLMAYPGNKIYTGDLHTGAKRTRADVFARETGWSRGLPLTDAWIKHVSSSLEALPFVVAADTALLISVSADTADLYVSLDEAAGARISGLVGWVPASADLEGYWGGEFEVQLLSPFGDGRVVALHVSRRDPQSRRTRLTYWEPWLLGAPFWFGLSLAQDDFGTDFIETRARVHFRLVSVSPRWELQLGVGRVTVEEEPTPATFSGDRYEAGVAVTDSSGPFSYRFGVHWSRQRLDSREGAMPEFNSIQYTRAEFGVSSWMSLRRSFLLRVHSDGAGTLSGPAFTPPNLLHRVGGLHSLRGYREEEFLVRDYLRTGVEWHVGSKDQSVFIFAESAWLNSENGLNRVLGSAGAGLRIGTRVLLLMAVPTEGGARQSKIHIGLSSAY